MAIFELTLMKFSGKGAKKFMSIVERFIEPHMIKKSADAEACAIETKVKAEIKAMKSVQEALDMHSRCIYRLKNEQIRIQDNIESVMKKASSIILDIPDDDIDDNEIDEDWLARFFKAVSDISTETLQDIWAQILAGEVKQPGGFSLRTLDIMRNLSQKEALIFTKIANVTVRHEGSPLLSSDELYMKGNNISYDDILLLDDCQLLNSNEINVTYTFRPGNNGLVNNDRLIAICKNQDELKFNVNHYKFTKAGVELLQLIESCNGDSAIINFSQIESLVKQCNISVHKITGKNKLGQNNFSTQPISNI